MNSEQTTPGDDLGEAGGDEGGMIDGKRGLEQKHRVINNSKQSVSMITTSFNASSAAISLPGSNRNALNIAQLPDDILLKILNYLGPRDLARASASCTRLQAVSSRLWRRHYKDLVRPRVRQPRVLICLGEAHRTGDLSEVSESSCSDVGETVMTDRTAADQEVAELSQGIVGSPFLKPTHIPSSYTNSSMGIRTVDWHGAFVSRYLDHVRHRRFFAAIDREPLIDPEAQAKVTRCEAEWGLKLPVAVRNFFGLKHVQRVVYKIFPTNNRLLTPTNNPSDWPLRDTDRGRKLLQIMEDNSGNSVFWYVMWDASDLDSVDPDPPVYVSETKLGEEEGQLVDESHLMLECQHFSTFFLTIASDGLAWYKEHTSNPVDFSLLDILD
eukprot:Clim_evm10s171 gene=Clim_evmTU10s171